MARTLAGVALIAAAAGCRTTTHSFESHPGPMAARSYVLAGALPPDQIEPPATLPADPEDVAAADARGIVSAAAPRPSMGVEQWRELICAYDWPCQEALAIVATESGGDANARNAASGACGLFQLLPCACIEPGCNVAHAYAKWVNSRSFYAHWYRWWSR
jgi:hypothetical protein